MAEDHDYYAVEVTREITETARILVKVPKGASLSAVGEAALAAVDRGDYPQGAFKVDDAAPGEAYIADELANAVTVLTADVFAALTE